MAPEMVVVKHHQPASLLDSLSHLRNSQGRLGNPLQRSRRGYDVELSVIIKIDRVAAHKL